MKRIKRHQVEGFTSAAGIDGQALVWDAAQQAYVPGDVIPTTVLVPLTTVVGGVPQLVWGADHQLVMTEVPR